ncbi:MAG TPA: hypothetical protein VN948_09105 [Terriglobales bacterium]|nr:hypothetical protein [Terriglobales bacterium]
MPFEIPRNNKFACVCLVFAAVDHRQREPIVLGDGLCGTFGTPFELDDAWRDWLGTVKTQNLQNVSLGLLAHRESVRLDVLDGENQALIDAALSLFYALLMVEIFHHDGGFVVSGANNGGEIRVRQITDLGPHLRPNGARVSAVNMATLESAAVIASGIRAMYSAAEPSERLRQGFRAWLRGIRESIGADRLHEFVRATEAVVKPQVGRTEAQFVHRCQLFSGTSDAARTIVRELYQLRSQTEHMNNFEPVLANYPVNDRDALALRRAYQAQLLGSSVYKRLLTTVALRVHFASDDDTDAFWRRDMREQRAIWGDPIDLEALATAQMM